jgi:hypothetical protein
MMQARIKNRRMNFFQQKKSEFSALLFIERHDGALNLQPILKFSNLFLNNLAF